MTRPSIEQTIEQALVGLGALLREAAGDEPLPALAARLGRRRGALRALLAGRGGAVGDLLAAARGLGLQVNIGPPGLLSETVRRVCARYGLTLDGLRARPVLAAHEAARAAELLGLVLRLRDKGGAYRFQGSARDEIALLQQKLRQMGRGRERP